MPKRKKADVCPTCGTCPTCGHRPGVVLQPEPYPVYPYYPYPYWTQPWYTPWTYTVRPEITWSGAVGTVSGNNVIGSTTTLMSPNVTLTSAADRLLC